MNKADGFVRVETDSAGQIIKSFEWFNNHEEKNELLKEKDIFDWIPKSKFKNAIVLILYIYKMKEDELPLTLKKEIFLDRKDDLNIATPQGLDAQKDNNANLF